MGRADEEKQQCPRYQRGGIWFPTESAFLGNEKNIQKDEKDALKKAEQHYDFYRPVMVSLEYCDRVLLEA